MGGFKVVTYIEDGITKIVMLTITGMQIVSVGCSSANGTLSLYNELFDRTKKHMLNNSGELSPDWLDLEKWEEGIK